MTWLKTLISPNVHLEPQRAPSSDQARDYCLKDRTRTAGPWELGSYQAHSAKRTDLSQFRDAILANASEASLWDTYPVQMARYPKMFQSLFTYGTRHAVPLVIPRRSRAPVVTVLIGPTRCGKTRFAYDSHSPSELYVCPITDGFWMDGYAGQEAVLLDEFTGNMPLRRFLSLLDRYPQRVPIKGGFVLWNPKWIYITSNLPPIAWYEWILYKSDGRTVKQDRTPLREAMYARFTFVYRATSSDGPLDDVTGSEYDDL